MKIIYLYLRRHCYTFDEKLFQLSAFTKKGWELERWSAVNWTFSNLEKPLNIDEGVDCHYIDNETLLTENLKRVKGQKCYFLIYPYDDSKCSWMIRKTIKQYGFKFANIAESLEIALFNTVFPLKISFSDVFIRELKKMIIYWISFIKAFVSKKENALEYLKFWHMNFWNPLLYKSDINFLTTVLYYYSFPNLFECFARRNKMIHSLSYDQAMFSNKSEKLIETPYVVFVDQYLSGHSDFVKTGWNFPVLDLNDYCKKLCALFEKIEKEYNCEVIIAAHPKAEYKGCEFSGRKIISGKTNDLIKDSLFVLIQTSTCFGLITAFKKPFINIYDSLFFKNCPPFYDSYVAIKNIFCCKQLDIGDKDQVSNYKSYITEYNNHFDEYNERYVISNNSIGTDKLFYEVIEETIRKRIR